MKILVLLLSLSGLALGVDSVDVKSQTSVTASTSTSNTVALAANRYRKWLYIRNQDASLPLYVDFVHSDGVSTTTVAVKIAAGAEWEPKVAPTDAIYVFTGSGSISATIMEAN